MSPMYTVSRGHDTAEVAEDVARDQWDQTPDDLRTGNREGSFILWKRGASGYLTAPVIFRHTIALATQ